MPNLSVTTAQNTGSISIAPPQTYAPLSVVQATTQPTLHVAAPLPQSIVQSPVIPVAPIQPRGKPAPVPAPTPTPAANPTPTVSMSSTPVKDTLAYLQSANLPKQSFGFMDGSQYDQHGNPLNQPNTDALNQSLNNAQDSALSQINSNPSSDLDALKSQANNLIGNATTNNQTLQNQLNQATTGQNDLRTQAQNNLQSLGITGLQDNVATAQKEYDQIRQQQLDNLSQRENQYVGGGTENFAQSLDSKDQRNIALNQLAASTKLQVSQQRLNSQMDVFKTFTQTATDQQSHQISELTQQLGLNKSDLTAGVSLLNQVRQETQNNQQASRQLLLGLATNYPGFFQQLNSTDQQAITQGQVTPSILAKLGQLQTYKDEQTAIKTAQLGINQQNADTTAQGLGVKTSSDYLNELNQLSQLNQLYPNNPYLQQIASQTFSQYQQSLNNQGTSQSPTSQGGVGITSPGIVGNYDLGAGKVMAPWANKTGHDKTNYEYASTISSLASRMPQFQSSSDIDQYIKSVSPNSPLTGQMIANASSQYGVDPRVLTAIMQQESSLGTKGAAVRTLNPGNVGNTNDGTLSNKGTWAGGVNAVASLLAKRQIPGSQNQAPQSTLASIVNPGTSGQGDMTSGSIFGNAGSQYGDDVEKTQSGGQWLDLTKYSDKNQKTAALNYARQNGVAAFSSQKEVDGIKAIDEARSNLTYIQGLLPQVLYSSVGSRALGGFGLSKLLSGATQTNQSQQALQSTGLAILGNIKAISQLPRVNQQEILLAENSVPKDSDTIQAGNTKLQTLARLLDNAEKSALGKYAPQSNSPSYLQGTQPTNYGNAAAQYGGIPLQ